MKKAQDQGLLGRYSVLSVILLIAGDLALEPLSAMIGGFLFSLFAWIPVIGAVIGGIMAFFGTLGTYFLTIALIGTLVLLNESLYGNKTEAIVDSLIVMFLLAIPTPILGVIAGLLQFLTMTKIIKT